MQWRVGVEESPSPSLFEAFLLLCGIASAGIGCGPMWLRAVSPASVQIDSSNYSAPDDHFTAGPHCRVKVSRSGRVGGVVAVQLSVLGLYLPPVFK